MYTVVVADDEEELRKSLIRRVNWPEAGFEVVGEAGSGIDALELVEKLEPDLLLSDVRMPFMTGIELARAVREIRPTMQIAFLSGYDDFSYAQQAIQYNIISYMLKPISSKELTEELKNIRQKIDKRFAEFTQKDKELEKQNLAGFLMPVILDSFQGQNSDKRDRELVQEAVRLGFLKSTEGELEFVVMVTSFWNEEGENTTTYANVNAVDSILCKYTKYASFYTDGRVVSLIAATRSGVNKYLHIIATDISQSVKRIMGLTASIGISRPIPRLINSHEAYIEAMNAMEYSGKIESGVHYIADIERANTFDNKMIQSALIEIERLLRGGSEQELQEYLHKLFIYIEEKKIAPAMMQPFVIQMISVAYRVVYAVADSESVKELQLSSPLPGRVVYERHQGLWEQCLLFCLEARKLVAEQRKKSGSVICDRALEIIENRYMDADISLVSISTEIAVSPNYLSTLIKKMTGSTFVELLTRKRIETAKGMLLQTTMKIREISEMCGYNDQHYFSYCFKKYTGISPNTCRRQNESIKNQ